MSRPGHCRVAIMSERQIDDALDFLNGGGQMSERIRLYDWSRTALGPLETWPRSLKTALKIALNTRYPIWMGWGRELVFFYNTAYAPVLGKRDEWALGASARDVWKESWEEHLRPKRMRYILLGEASWNDLTHLRQESDALKVRHMSEDRKRAEARLQESEERWRAVFENSAVGIALTDLNGRFLATNSAYQRMLGYSAEEFQALCFIDITHEDDRDSNRVLITELLDGFRDQFQIEKRYWRRDGALIWVRNSVSLAPGSENMPVAIMAIVEDITERKRTEETLRRTQAELTHVTVAARLGEMTASIAHEVNQPLAAVVANGHACLRWLSASPPNVAKAAEAAERIVKDGKDAGEVVRRVRALFKRTPVEKVPLDLGEVIGEVLRLLDSYPGRQHVLLDVALDPDLPRVFADRVQLQQLLMNLMVNALEALEPVCGRVRQMSVRSKCEGAGRDPDLDNGIGLDDSVAAFEPFVSTKPEGMGLGLAICRSIVAAHEGRLSAERNVGFGTTFTVTLPIQPVGSA